MKEIWHQMAVLVKKRQPFVSASIVKKTGSAPRTSGARMIICEDLSIFGTLGGGGLESETLLEAKKLFETQSSKCLSFNLTGKNAGEMGMICGSHGEILLVYINPEDPFSIALIKALIRSERERKKGWLLTTIEQNGRSQQCLLEEDGHMVGNFQLNQGHFLGMNLELKHLAAYIEGVLGAKVFIEKVFSSCERYRFGAGQVIQKINPIPESEGREKWKGIS